jgi:hypothetical protein
VESFSSNRTIADTIGFVQSCSTKVADALPIGDRFRSELTSAVTDADWSQSDKKAFLESFNKTFEPSYNQSAEYINAVQKWLSATDRLYQFALKNRRDYRISGGRLMFINAAKLEEFNSLREEYETYRKQATAAKNCYDEASQEFAKRFGVQWTDLGFNNEQR